MNKVYVGYEPKFIYEDKLQKFLKEQGINNLQFKKLDLEKWYEINP